MKRLKLLSKIPRNFSLVKFIFPKGYEEDYPWSHDINDLYCDNCFLFLGEIPNMPEHCAIVYNQKVYFGYHTSDFVELKEDEM